MGVYTEVSRFFQRIESPTRRGSSGSRSRTTARGRTSSGSIRDAMALAAKSPGVDTAEVKIGGLPAYVVTDRSHGTAHDARDRRRGPGRLVLASGANVEQDAAAKLLGLVDYAKVAAAR